MQTLYYKPWLFNLSERLNHLGTQLKTQLCGFPDSLIQEVWLGPRSLHFRKHTGGPAQVAGKPLISVGQDKQNTLPRNTPMKSKPGHLPYLSLPQFGSPPAWVYSERSAALTIEVDLPSRARLFGPEALAAESNCWPASQPPGAASYRSPTPRNRSTRYLHLSSALLPPAAGFK